MGRLHGKYIISSFLLALLILIVFNNGLAAQEEKSDENKGVTEATDEESDVPEDGVAEYIYDPTGKTDPFKSFIITREEKEKEEAKTKTYLETLELSQLDLVIIVVSEKGKWAMVKDSKGEGHVIKEGTPIGTNNGVVYKITQGEVIIREEITDFRGQKQHRDISKTAKSQI